MVERTGSMVVLFGAPAVGKDSVTAALEGRESGFAHFIKHKRGSASRHGYTVVSEGELQTMRDEGRIVSEVERYGATYAIERTRLNASLATGKHVLIHSAEPREARLLRDLGAILILLECTRETAATRLRLRDPSTVLERLAVWDRVESQLDELEPIARLRLSTDHRSPEQVADEIERTIRAGGGGGVGGTK
jgi:guanylate kinase